MQIKHTRDGEVLRLQVEGDLTIYGAPEAKPALLSALSEAEERIELDLAGVHELDSAGFQLLLLLRREAGRAGKQVCLVRHSPGVDGVLRTYHMQDYFGPSQRVDGHVGA